MKQPPFSWQRRCSYLKCLYDDRKGVFFTIFSKQVVTDAAEGEMLVVEGFEMGLAGNRAFTYSKQDKKSCLMTQHNFRLKQNYLVLSNTRRRTRRELLSNTYRLLDSKLFLRWLPCSILLLENKNH